MSSLNLPQPPELATSPKKRPPRSLVEAMSFLAPGELPRIGQPLGARPSPIVEVTNPSTVSPSNQQFVAPTIDQTKKVTRTPGGIADSNGELQRLDLSPGQQGVNVTEQPMFLGSFRGERFHQMNLEPIDQGVRVRIPAGSRNPVVNVNVASQNVSRPRPTRAIPLPRATTVDAGKANHAGLPTNHNIR